MRWGDRALFPICALGVSGSGAWGAQIPAQTGQRDRPGVSDAADSNWPEIEDLVADGDRVCSRIRITGTHLGALDGYAPTGVLVDTGFVAIERYADGLCVEEWVYSDDLGIARQIKALPAAGGVGERVGQLVHRMMAPLVRRSQR